MANSTADYGFVFHKGPYGEPALKEMVKPTAVEDVFVGDVVALGGSAVDGVPTLILHVTGALTMFGVVMGFKSATRSSLTAQYAASADVVTCMVMPCYPEIEFRVNSVQARQNDVGLFFNVDDAVGSQLTGKSGMFMVNEAGSTTTGGLRLVGFARRPDNEFSTTDSTDTDDVDCIVVFHESIWLIPGDDDLDTGV